MMLSKNELKQTQTINQRLTLFNLELNPTSKRTYHRSIQSLSFRYVIMWLSSTSLAFWRPKKMHSDVMLVSRARLTALS